MKIRDAQIFSDKVVDIIRIEQQRMGISNYTLAQRANLSEASLSYIYHHKRRPTLYTLALIADKLGISLSEIIERAERESNKK